MADYDVNVYNFDPNFTFSLTVGGSIVYGGPANSTGTASITDNGSGTAGLTLEDNTSGETATADVTIDGNTSTGVAVSAEEAWTLLDTTTGQTFQLVTFHVESGPAAGYFTLSELPLVPGHTFQTLQFDTDPDVDAGDPVFTYANYVVPAYISEISYDGNGSSDFVEIAVEAGTDMSGYSIYSYKTNGKVDDGPLSLGSVQSSAEGKDVYVVDDGQGLGNIKFHGAVALVDGEGNVVQFISFEGNTVTATEGPADGLTSTDIGTAGATESLQSDDGGASYYTQTAPNEGTIPCYAPGTMIDTPSGPRAVETLKSGDLVMTLDHGLLPIRWTRSGDHPLEDADDDAKPVLIKAGALGRDLPIQDLIVSPQHRILVGGGGQLQPLFATEAFAPAKSLTAVPGIRPMRGKTQITWVHFACDRHEVVTANGCLSESLLLGPMVLNGLNAAEREVLTDIFGPAQSPVAALNGSPARECLTVGAVRRQLAKHLKEKGHLGAKPIRKWDVGLTMEQYETGLMREAKSKDQSSNRAA